MEMIDFEDFENEFPNDDHKMAETLSPDVFPVDELTLSMLESSLDAHFDGVDENGDPTVSDGRATLSRFLGFMSGYNPELLTPVDGRDDWMEYPEPQFTEKDVIRSLIAEIRKLRGESDTIR